MSEQNEIDESQIKFADLKELRELGILQEANRLFFHPLGLAMIWIVEETGETTFAGFQDDREDPEGCLFSDLSDPECIERKIRVEELRKKHAAAREKILEGSTIQPIGGILV